VLSGGIGAKIRDSIFNWLSSKTSDELLELKTSPDFANILIDQLRNDESIKTAMVTAANGNESLAKYNFEQLIGSLTNFANTIQQGGLNDLITA
jgi:hypothetical protein